MSQTLTNPCLCDAEKVTKQKYIVYKAGLFALQTRCEDNRKVARRQNPLFCFVPVLLRIWLHNSGFTLLSSSRGHIQLVRNACVWSQVDRFSSCPTSPFCSRRGILESRDHHNGALSHRAGKLDLCSERTDSCWRGFHNATIYIRKWAEYFLKKKRKKKEKSLHLFLWLREEISCGFMITEDGMLKGENVWLCASMCLSFYTQCITYRVNFA